MVVVPAASALGAFRNGAETARDFLHARSLRPTAGPSAWGT